MDRLGFEPEYLSVMSRLLMPNELPVLLLERVAGFEPVYASLEDWSVTVNTLPAITK